MFDAISMDELVRATGGQAAEQPQRPRSYTSAAGLNRGEGGLGPGQPTYSTFHPGLLICETNAATQAATDRERPFRSAGAFNLDCTFFPGKSE